MPQLDDLLGSWRLSRRILDRRAREAGHLTGHTTFRPGAGGAVQVEEGTLVLPGRPPMTATRTYLWSTDSGHLILRFADGSDFHAFDGNEERPEAEHLCGDDLYHVRYDFRRWPVWRAVWRVTGPRKDLILAATLAPLADPLLPGQNHRDAETE